MIVFSEFLKKLSYLSYIFVIPNKSANIKYNIVFTLLMILIVSIPDIILNISGTGFIIFHTVILIVMFVTCFLLSFCGTFLKILISTFVFITQLMQLNYMYFSGIPIDPLLIPKILTETGDIIENAKVVWKIEPFIIIPFIGIIYYTLKFKKKMYFSIFACTTVVCCFGWLFYTESKRDISKFIIKPTRQTIRNSMTTSAFFLTHVKSINSFDKSLPQKAYVEYSVKKISSNTPRIVVIFWGESTNDRDMSVINKKCRETTPLLTKFSQNHSDNFLAMTAISGSVATLSSTPLFFNMIREPGNIYCLQTMKHNLFKMAKENGYKTHWLSTQSIIIPESSSIFADEMHNFEKHTIKVERKHDDYLIELFNNLDLSKGKHLIVINPRSVHIPYDTNYEHHKEKFEKYTNNLSVNSTKRSTTLNMYHNNIIYLDWLLNELLSIAIKKDVDYFFITSDHGEIIGTNGEGIHGTGLYGHNFLIEDVARVPFLMYSKKKDKKLFRQFKKLGVISHYEISKFIANLIGYDVKNPNEKGALNNFFIHDASIVGDYRFINYIRENGKIKKVNSDSTVNYINNLIAEKKKK